MKSQQAVSVDAARMGQRINFLQDRQQFTDLSPLEAASNMGYVWKRVFLKRTAAKA